MIKYLTEEDYAEIRRKGSETARRYAAKYPERIKANRMATRAIERGELIRPDRCEECDKKPYFAKIHAHHDDYTKPLDIRWLCGSCHKQYHLMLDDKPTKPVVVMPDKEYKSRKREVVLLSHRCHELTSSPSYWDMPIGYRQCRMGVVSGTNYCRRHKS